MTGRTLEGTVPARGSTPGPLEWLCHIYVRYQSPDLGAGVDRLSTLGWGPCVRMKGPLIPALRSSHGRRGAQACLGVGILSLRHLYAPGGPPDLHSKDVGSSFMLSMKPTRTAAGSRGQQRHIHSKHFWWWMRRLSSSQPPAGADPLWKTPQRGAGTVDWPCRWHL